MCTDRVELANELLEKREEQRMREKAMRTEVYPLKQTLHTRSKRSMYDVPKRKYTIQVKKQYNVLLDRDS